MCNRFANLHRLADIDALAQMLGLELEAEDTIPCADIFPDRDVPVLHRRGDVLHYGPMRWGLPPIPGQHAPITNIRNLASRWWREQNRSFCLEAMYRCLVPVSAFAEPARDSTWFEMPGAVACFAGIWHPWRGERLAGLAGTKRRVRQARDWNLFAFLTCAPNAMVRPVHDAMPVVLTDPDEMKLWLAGGAESFRLQRPLPEDRLKRLAPVPVSPAQGQLF